MTRWSVQPATGRISASPTVVDDTVYVGVDHSGLYAFDTDTGDEQWSVTDKIQGVQSSPTVVDGIVYFGEGNTSTHTGALHAADATTGITSGRFPNQMHRSRRHRPSQWNCLRR
ncbi:hypothetical protein D8S78_16045 [Natrialba swarupiae]|nr:hypothetical protein [Natrialba swarupiae]